MALLNATMSKDTTKKDRVAALAAAGNTAAQEYLKTGSLNPTQKVTDSKGKELTASDIVGQVASGNVGGYNVSQRSQTIAQVAAASGYTTPSQISTIAPNLTGTSLVAGNKYQGTYNPATVGYRSSMTDNKGELFYKPEDAEKQAEYLTKNKMPPITSTTPIGDQVSIADGITAQEKARKLLDQYGTMAVTQPEWQESIRTMLAAGIENINKQNPTPRDPVFPTKAQQEKVAADITGTEQERYNQLYKELGQGKLQEQRIDVMKQLQAVQEVYQKVIDQIKENPNLPKGLAGRRLTEVFEDQKFAANALIAQLDVIDQQIEYNNGEIDRQLGIFEYDKSQEEKEQERRMSQLEMLISSGAVAGMSPAELQQWSAASGMPLQALQKVQKDMMDPAKSYGVEFREDGANNLLMITYDKNNPVDRTIEQIGQAKVTTGGGGTIPLTPEKRRSLVDAGFTAEQVQDLESSINARGLPETLRLAGLEGASQTQLNAIENVYGEAPTTSGEQVITKDSLKSMYGGDAMLTKLALDAGFTKEKVNWGPWPNETVGDAEAYLNSIWARVEAMRGLNMSDADILKALQ